MLKSIKVMWVHSSTTEMSEMLIIDLYFTLIPIIHVDIKNCQENKGHISWKNRPLPRNYPIFFIYQYQNFIQAMCMKIWFRVKSVVCTQEVLVLQKDNDFFSVMVVVFILITIHHMLFGSWNFNLVNENVNKEDVWMVIEN